MSGEDLLVNAPKKVRRQYLQMPKASIVSVTSPPNLTSNRVTSVGTGLKLI